MSRSIRASQPARRRAAKVGAAFALACLSMAGPAAHAHGFGQRYDLPLPLALYLTGVAAAIVFSFVVVALFVRRAPPSLGYPRLHLLGERSARSMPWRAIVLAIKVVSVVLFVTTIAAGFGGNPDPYRNIAPTLVWIIAWVGIAYVSAFVGDLWLLVNPWRILFSWAESLYRRASRGRELSLRLPYPEALGVWPAFVLLLAFSWTELVYPSPALPLHIAWMMVGYSVLTWTAMAVYGRETWLRSGELFSVVFGVFARFAPTEAEPGRGELWLRPYGAGLLDGRPVASSMAAFVLLILSCVLYDGVLATPEWVAFETRAVAMMPSLGESAAIAIRTVGLGAFWLLFFGAYVAVSALMSRIVSGRRSAWEIARIFTFTLVPIAIAYHLAHYLSYLLIQGQYIVPLLSDPFGYGWNLFGTAGYRVDIGLVGARFAWYAAVTAIVVGHIFAVYLAHRRAMQVLDGRGAALRSQVPLTALMVVYTFVSLSILAEPITERSVAAPAAEGSSLEVSVPADAMLPSAGDGRPQAVGAGKTARQRLTYRVLGSAFHDGTAMSVADLLYPYMFAYRWSLRNPAEPLLYDPFVDAATAPMRERLAGVKFTGTDTVSKSFRVGDINIVRELFVFDVYTTTASEDPEQDAVIAPPWSAVPWHVLVLMEEAVRRGWAAFSEAEASRRGTEWLDLARSEPLNKRLAGLVETFASEGYRPEALRSLVSADEARKRWAALAAFYRDHGHFLVTDGPYQLKSWTGDSATLTSFRDLSYPLGVGSYDAYAIPRRGFIARVEQQNERVKLFAEIETIMKYQRSYDIVRMPLQSVEPDVLKRSAPECRYLVLDSGGRAVLAGTATLGDDATFAIDLAAAKLPAGRYDLLAEILVDRNAMNAEIKRTPVTIGPQS